MKIVLYCANIDDEDHIATDDDHIDTTDDKVEKVCLTGWQFRVLASNLHLCGWAGAPIKKLLTHEKKYSPIRSKKFISFAQFDKFLEAETRVNRIELVDSRYISLYEPTS